MRQSLRILCTQISCVTARTFRQLAHASSSGNIQTDYVMQIWRLADYAGMPDAWFGQPHASKCAEKIVTCYMGSDGGARGKRRRLGVASDDTAPVALGRVGESAWMIAIGACDPPPPRTIP